MDILYPYGGAVFAPVAAGYIASLGARWKLRRGKRPDWVVALCAIVAGILAAWLLNFQFDPFIPARWSQITKVSLFSMMMITGLLAAMLSGPIVAYVLMRYQKR